MDVDALPPVSRRQMARFYQELFPFQRTWDWLSYGNASKMAFREFAFHRPEGNFRRFRSYGTVAAAEGSSIETVAAFEREVVDEVPDKIDIGAVFSWPPSKRGYAPPPFGFVDLERELVFDIDLTDYDDVRVCCKGKEACRLCWKLAAAAMHVVDAALREDFGFLHILWVYSGRRGVHCWVCDERARVLTDEGRSAVVGYFRRPNSDPEKHTNYLHPHMTRAEAILRRTFEQRARVSTVDLFARWAPRLDENVTKKRNHLLKAPFCAHPSTGRVCVPLDLATCASFDPDACPTVASLLHELDAYVGPEGVPNHAKTALKGPMAIMDRFLAALVLERRERSLPRSDMW
jgi:DNA primase small subunit